MQKIKSDDKVKVIAGKYKWTISVVDEVVSDNKIIVKWVNVAKKATGKDANDDFIEVEQPIDISNVMFFCDECKTPIRVKIGENDDGQKRRYCRNCDTAYL